MIASQQEQSAMAQTGRRSTTTQQSVTQLASEVQVGGDLSLGAGRDIAIVGSTVAAGKDMSLQAGGDIVIAAAANESHFEHHRKGGGKQVDIERTSIVQHGAELSAGGNFISQSGGDTTLISSNIAAGQQAYLYAGGNLNLLAAQDVEYDLYDKKEKGSFGRRETRRDEVTDVRHVGSSITAGGDLSLISEGDQHYQNARLQSGNDLTLDAGGAITFEVVKDLHQESHERSKSDWAWNAAKGKGTTDETLIQSQLIAQGNLAIRAAEGIQIDIKEIDQNTVSQTIDAMVQADPDLAWLKQMEAQGDIDWRTVKEVHDSFDYSHSGLGVGAQLVIAIAVSAIVGPAASGLAGGGGLGAAAGAAASGAATNASVSFINNRGDLGAVFKDVTSSNAIKGYATAALTAGITTGYLDQAFGVETDFVNHTTKGFDIGTVGGVAKFGSHLAAQGAIQATSQTLINGGSFSNNLEAALTAQIYHLAQAIAFNAVGDLARSQGFAEGGLEKTALHALTGGLISQAMGQDFATGALAAGANEFLVERLSQYADLNKGLEQAASQIVGAVAAGITGGDVHHAAELAKNATAYNRQLHAHEKALAKKLHAESGLDAPLEAYEDAIRMAGRPGEGIFPNTDMVVGADGIYDFGGLWVQPEPGTFIQLLNYDLDPEVVRFVQANTEGYVWHDQALGIKAPLGTYSRSPEFAGSWAMAGGFDFNLNYPELRTDSALMRDQRAFTLGVASVPLIPAAGLAFGAGRAATGFAWGAGLDLVGQSMSAGPYRPAQTVTSGYLGVLAYPMATTSFIGNSILGASVTASAVAVNNHINDETGGYLPAALGGAFGGFAATGSTLATTSVISRYAPSRVGGVVLDPSKPALLQNLGRANPYPAAVGNAVGNTVGWAIPFALERYSREVKSESSR